MPVTTVEQDAAALTLTLTAEYPATPDQVWQLWADPRKLERWWGPPTYPATFEEHDLTPGGRVTYFMTGPEGDTPRGWWRVLRVEAPGLLEIEDGFADGDGSPDPAMPVMTMRVTIRDVGAGTTRMIIETGFPSPEAMERIISMGMEEGLTAAIGQADAVLAG